LVAGRPASAAFTVVQNFKALIAHVLSDMAKSRRQINARLNGSHRMDIRMILARHAAIPHGYERSGPSRLEPSSAVFAFSQLPKLRVVGSSPIARITFDPSVHAGSQRED
jgi:hypothetical protein